MAKKITPLAQVVRGVEQLTDKELREQTRWYVPSAIERLAALCNSNNEAISLGAIKVMLAKNIPDLKAMEIKPGEDGFIMKVEYVRKQDTSDTPSGSDGDSQRQA